MNSSGNLVRARGRPLVVASQPNFASPDSQLVTAAQIYEQECRAWFERLFGSVVLDRKCWEYAYILQAIHKYGRIGHGSRGLGFGCGKEAIASVLAASGSAITATDFLDQAHGWEARKLEDIFHSRFISRGDFDQRVRFVAADMNRIPSNFEGFDYLWSCGALEHIGGHDAGMTFVKEAMKCLRPGGLAVHTTEYVISTDDYAFNSPELSFYTKRDVESLAMELLEAGHLIVLNLNRGSSAADLHVDVPPYNYGRTLAAHFHSHVITSIGLIIQKDGLRL